MNEHLSRPPDNIGEAEQAARDTSDFGSGRWAALALLCLAQFMLVLDITVVQVALPSIGAELDLGRAELTWVVTTYLLFFGSLMIMGGRLADEFGLRRILLIGLALFTLASLLCGLATSAAALLLGRAVQGIGAAMLSPAALGIITTAFHGPVRDRALAVWAAIGGSGAAVGVLLGGVLTTGPGWEWIFYLNLPVGLLIGILLPRVVAAHRPQRRRGRVDVAGAIAITAGTALLIYGLVQAGDAGWTTATTLLPLTAAAACYLAFIGIEHSAQAPLVRLELLARRPVVSGAFVMLTATGMMLGLFFLSSLYLQQVVGLGALQTGLIFLPIAGAITAGAHLGGQLLHKAGGRIVGTAGFILAALGGAMLTQISASNNPLVDMLPGFMLAALGIGATFVAATSTALTDVSHAESGITSAVVNTFHELGGSIGVAVVSTAATASLDTGTADIGGFVAGFAVCAIAGGAAALLATVLIPAGKATAVVGHGH